MSKAIYAIHRSKKLNNDLFKEHLFKICESLTPDNIHSQNEHTLHVEGDTAIGISLNRNGANVFGLNLLIGKLYEKEDFDWKTVLGPKPDGNFALIRADDRYAELVTDGLATRTLWFYKDDEWFVSSTSQRAIIQFIGNFEFNRAVVPWMLSTGSLGPDLSWDKRIQRVKPNSAIVLDKKEWSLKENWNRIYFEEIKKSKKEHREELYNAIQQTFDHLKNLDFSKWLLPLSGGYDSRAILYLLQNRLNDKSLRTVTWGDKESLKIEGNDAKIATELAEFLNIPNQYYYTDNRRESYDVVLSRFLRCGEGRTDRVAGYIDGLQIWKSFYENGATGIIRGDEAFGWLSINSYESVIHLIEFAMCKDFRNLADISETYNFPEQKIPEYLEKGQNESLEDWRDRLYQAYRIPTKLAAMSDVKLAYVEVISPFLSKRILETVRQLPANMRSNKILFSEIVEEITVDFPIATLGAETNLKNLLIEKKMIDFLVGQIEDEDAEELLGKDFISFVVGSLKEMNVHNKKMKKGKKHFFSYIIPKFVIKWLRKNAPRPKMAPELLLFRTFIVISMHKILTKDANLLANKPKFHNTQ
jgi:hypothetical protein